MYFVQINPLNRCPKVFISNQFAFIQFQEKNKRPFSWLNIPRSPEQKSWIVQTLFKPEDIDFKFFTINTGFVNNFLSFLILHQNIFNNIIDNDRFSLYNFEVIF